jgi:hypothetical protein
MSRKHFNNANSKAVGKATLMSLSHIVNQVVRESQTKKLKLKMYFLLKTETGQ